MAVQHMVWMKFNDSITADRIDWHMNNLAGLAVKIDVIQHLSVGPSFTDRARGYTHGLLVTLADRNALTTYLDHPEHIAVAKPLKEDADVMAVDIEE